MHERPFSSTAGPSYGHVGFSYATFLEHFATRPTRCFSMTARTTRTTTSIARLSTVHSGPRQASPQVFRSKTQRGSGPGTVTPSTGALPSTELLCVRRAIDCQFFSVPSVQWRHQWHHRYQSHWCFDFSAAALVLVGINRSTNSVGPPATYSRHLRLHRAGRRVSSTAVSDSFLQASALAR